MNEMSVEIDGEHNTWTLNASRQNGCSVMKDNSRRTVNGLRILAIMDDYQVCVLISPAEDSDKINSVDVYIEDLYTNVPDSSWKHLVADSLMVHLEKVFDYCQALPNPNIVSIINENTIYN